MKEFVSQPLYVESSNLVISGISKTYVEVPSFSTLTRTITIKNTRSGVAGSFNIKHDPYIKLTIDKGRIIDQNAKSTEIILDSVDFKKIGNKDAYFDFNESVDLHEDIMVTTCSYDRQFDQIRLYFDLGMPISMLYAK